MSKQTCLAHIFSLRTIVLRLKYISMSLTGITKLSVLTLPAILSTVLMTCIVYDTVELGCNNNNMKLSVAFAIYGFVIISRMLLIS